MPLFHFEGRVPVVAPGAWIAPTAALIGEVSVEEGASIWYGTVLRADAGPIVVRAGANVQDGSVLHSGLGQNTDIGEGATVGHLCVVHGAVVGAEALIGNGATVQDGAWIGARALVAAGSLVPPGARIPAGTLFRGDPGAARGPLTPSAQRWVDTNPAGYRALARRHARGSGEVPAGAAPRVGVGVVVRDPAGGLLLVRRGVDPGYGLWALPAGFVEPGEDPRAAATREAREETGLEVRVGAVVDVYAPTDPGGATIFVAFAAEVTGGELRPGDDALDAAFFPTGRLPELAFASTRAAAAGTDAVR